MSNSGQSKKRYCLSVTVGSASPFHARIFEVGGGQKFETQLASLADVEGFLNDVRPTAWVDEVGTHVENEALTVVSRRPEPLGVLIQRAVRTLDTKESSVGHADLILADEDLETLWGHFEKWKRMPAP